MTKKSQVNSIKNKWKSMSKINSQNLLHFYIQEPKKVNIWKWIPFIISSGYTTCSEIIKQKVGKPVYRKLLAFPDWNEKDLDRHANL